MPTSIQRTTIEGTTVEIIVADAADPDDATTWVRLRVRVEVADNRPLAECQSAALHLARSALDAEMTRLKSLQGRASAQNP